MDGDPRPVPPRSERRILGLELERRGELAPECYMEVGFWSDTLLGSPLPAGGPGPAPGVRCLPTSPLPPLRHQPRLSPPTGPLRRPPDLEGPAPPSPCPRASSTPSTRPGPQEVFDNRGSRTERGLLDVHRASWPCPGSHGREHASPATPESRHLQKPCRPVGLGCSPTPASSGDRANTGDPRPQALRGGGGREVTVK